MDPQENLISEEKTENAEKTDPKAVKRAKRKSFLIKFAIFILLVVLSIVTAHFQLQQKAENFVRKYLINLVQNEKSVEE